MLPGIGWGILPEMGWGMLPGWGWMCCLGWDIITWDSMGYYYLGWDILPGMGYVTDFILDQGMGHVTWDGMCYLRWDMLQISSI